MRRAFLIKYLYTLMKSVNVLLKSPTEIESRAEV